MCAIQLSTTSTTCSNSSPISSGQPGNSGGPQSLKDKISALFSSIIINKKDLTTQEVAFASDPTAVTTLSELITSPFHLFKRLKIGRKYNDKEEIADVAVEIFKYPLKLMSVAAAIGHVVKSYMGWAGKATSWVTKIAPQVFRCCYIVGVVFSVIELITSGKALYRQHQFKKDFHFDLTHKIQKAKELESPEAKTAAYCKIFTKVGQNSSLLSSLNLDPKFKKELESFAQKTPTEQSEFAEKNMNKLSAYIVRKDLQTLSQKYCDISNKDMLTNPKMSSEEERKVRIGKLRELAKRTGAPFTLDLINDMEKLSDTLTSVLDPTKPLDEEKIEQGLNQIESIRKQWKKRTNLEVLSVVGAVVILLGAASLCLGFPAGIYIAFALSTALWLAHTYYAKKIDQSPKEVKEVEEASEKQDFLKHIHLFFDPNTVSELDQAALQASIP